MTPCQAYPHEFDRDPEAGECQLTEAEVIALCWTCPLLGACTTARDPGARGIVAGSHRPHRVESADMNGYDNVIGTPKYLAALDYLELLLRDMHVGQALPGIDTISQQAKINRQCVTAAMRQLEAQGRVAPGARGRNRTVLSVEPVLATV